MKVVLYLFANFFLVLSCHVFSQKNTNEVKNLAKIISKKIDTSKTKIIYCSISKFDSTRDFDTINDDVIFRNILAIPEIFEYKKRLDTYNRKFVIRWYNTVKYENKLYIIYSIGEDENYEYIGIGSTDFDLAKLHNNETIFGFDRETNKVLSISEWRKLINK